MVTVVVHEDCGELVECSPLGVAEPGGGDHACRDYVAWHAPVDRRDPMEVDVPDGWLPALRR